MIIPIEAFEQHMIVLGKTGAGKSSAMRFMVESLLKKDYRVIVVTAKADWWGLKLAADGRHAGYPIVVFGGEHSDMPLNHLSGKTMAELLGTGNRSAVLQMRDFMPGERTTFWIDFASNLFRVLQGKLFLVIDEVHNFAPKGKVLDVQAGKMLHWSNKLAAEARGLGITLIAASQRPAKVHNDFLTSCETLIAMRVTTSWDREAVESWIDGCGDDAIGKQVVSSLAQMKRGDAWAWSPEIEFGPKQIHFPLFETYDSFKPQAPADVAKLKGWADVDLAEVRDKLASVVKEAEANDPAKLKARIRELESRERTKPTATKEVKVADPQAIAKAVAGATNSYRKMLSENAATLREIAAMGQRIATAAERAAGKEIPKPETPKMPVITVTHGAPPKASAPAWERKTSRVFCDSQTGEPLPIGEKTVLIAVAQYQEGVKRDQLSVLSGYKRSSRDAYLARLKQRGYIDERGGKIISTEHGIAALGSDYEPLPEGEELQRYWLDRLPEGEKKILEVLLAQNGQPIDRDALDEATGYKRSSRDAYLSRLTARRIVESVGQGQVKAADILFS